MPHGERKSARHHKFHHPNADDIRIFFTPRQKLPRKLCIKFIKTQYKVIYIVLHLLQCDIHSLRYNLFAFVPSFTIFVAHYSCH